MWEQGVFPVGDMHPSISNLVITSEPWPWNRKHRKHTMFRRRVLYGNASSLSQWNHLLYGKEKVFWWKDF